MKREDIQEYLDCNGFEALTSSQGTRYYDEETVISIALEVVKNRSIHDAGRGVCVEVEDRDIATIEALHDLLIDAHGYSFDFITLKRARELTAKMYEAFDLHDAQRKTMRNLLF